MPRVSELMSIACRIPRCSSILRRGRVSAGLIDTIDGRAAGKGDNGTGEEEVPHESPNVRIGKKIREELDTFCCALEVDICYELFDRCIRSKGENLGRTEVNC